MTAADSNVQADRIEQATDLDYEAEAIAAIVRSWRLTDPVCQALALQDGLVWATLHQARVTREGR